MAYPSSLDVLRTDLTGADDAAVVDHAGLHNAVNAAVMAVQAELGLDPSGAAATVAARLAAIEADSRWTNARTPTAHKASHAAGGSDVLSPADIGAATSAQGAKADTAVQPARAVSAGTGLTGGGDLSADRTLAVAAGGIGTTQLADSSVTSAKIADGTIVDADISAAAAVAQTKVADLVPALASKAPKSIDLASQVAPMPNAAETILKQAVWWIDSAHQTAADQTVQNIGWGGAALNAVCGAGTGADSNDPKFLAFDGTPYVYLPGTSNNFLSVPESSVYDLSDNVDVRVKVALDDWTPAGNNALWCKQDAYTFGVASTGNLYIQTVIGTYKTADSGAAVPASDGAVKWVRFTHESAVGTKFYTSDDGTTWTQLGTTKTTALGSFATNDNQPLIGGRGTADQSTGKVYRAQVLNGINGTPVLDIDTSVITSGSATTFPALTGQTVTINRATSGRKAVAVVHPCWLFGTDDYMQVPDNDLLDFGASDSFTVLAFIRQLATPVDTGRILQKGSSAARYALYASTAPGVVATIRDGSAVSVSTDALTTTNTTARLHTMVLDRTAQVLTQYVNTVASAGASTSGAGSLVNSDPLQIGKMPGGIGYQDFEGFALAVFRRVLTSSEIATITDYYASRIGA